MAELIFWDVDTQVDFMLPGRILYVPGAERLLPRLGALTEHARKAGIRRLGSEDSHSMSDPEISLDPDWKTTFPPHCMAGTEGQRRVPETAPRDPLYIETRPIPPDQLREMVEGHAGEILFRKQTLDAFQNPNVEPVLDLVRPSAVVVYGVAQDICVRYAIQRFLRHARERVYAVTDATCALDGSRGQELFEEWRANGVRTLTTAEVLSGAVTGDRRGAA